MKQSSLASLDAAALGLHFDQNTQYLYGYYHGFPLYIRENFEGAFALFTSVKKEGQAPDGHLRETLLNHPDKLIDTVTLSHYQFSTLFKSNTQKQELERTITMVLEWVFKHLKDGQWQACCEQTGQTKTIGLYSLDRQVQILTDHVYETAASTITAKAQAPEKLSIGLLGGLLGGLLAGMSLLFIAFQGYAIGLLGFLIGLLTVLGYRLLARKISLKSLLVSLALVLLITLVINELDFAVFFVKKQGLSNIGRAFTDIYRGNLVIRDTYYWTNFFTLLASALLGTSVLSAIFLKKSSRPIIYRRLLTSA